ncbi:hypothetical protein vseg_017343 [Gypsophila vaccaria]
MSLNQTRFPKNVPQFHKPGAGRSSHSPAGHPRPFGGGGRGRPAPSSTPTPTPPFSSTSTRSYKVNDAHGAHSRPNAPPTVIPPPSLDTAAAPPPLLPPSQGVSSAPPPAGNARPAEKTGRPLPRAPSSQPPSSNSDSTLPSTPNKGAGAKGFSLQFGSLSPGFMNGMQVPARTSSAPPNLDEQKLQARCEPLRAVPEVPLPFGSKQDVLKKDAAYVEKLVTQKTNTEPQANRHVQVSSASPPIQVQKATALPMTGISMASPFHQASASTQFGGPTPQNQSQGVSTSSLQMPLQMPLHNMGNPSQVPQQVFVTGMQHPIMQTHGMMHQGQNMGYNPQLASQVPHQLGNIGINMPTQYSQPPVGKYVRTRKTVKITHPDTHEELRLDGRDGVPSGSMSHHSVQTQNQPIPTYTANPMGYYSNNYTAGPPIYPAPSSLPLTNTQSNASTQGTRFNYALQGHSNVPFANQSPSTFSVKNGISKHGSADPSNTDRIQTVQSMTPLAKPSSTPVTIKAPGEKAACSSIVGKVEPPKLNPILELDVRKKDVEESLQSKSGAGTLNQTTLVPASVQVTSPAALDTNPRDLESAPSCVDLTHNAKEAMSISIGDIQTQPSKKEIVVPSQQVDGKLDSEKVKGVDDASKTDTLETSKTRMILSSPTDGVLETISLESSESPAVVSSVNSSHSPDCRVSEIVIENSFKQQDLPSCEDITSESSNTQDKGEAECPQVLFSDNSLKASDGIKGDDQHKISHMEKAGLVQDETEASQNEAENVNMEHKLSDACDNLVSKTSPGLLKSHIIKEFDVSKSSISDNQVIHVSDNILEPIAGHEAEIVQNQRPSSSSGSISGSSKASLESSKTKNRGKKKLKELLQKADALGTTADLYMAYKGPEDKKESPVASGLAAEEDTKDMSAGDDTEESIQERKDEPSNAELDDWEDADISSPKLESSIKEALEEEGVTAKKYSRDFLLTFSDHCKDLPAGFKITSDVAECVMLVSVGVSTPHRDRDYSSSVRVVDRPGGVARPDRRGSGTMDDKWNKHPIHFASASDPRMDLAYGTNVLGYDSGRVPYGVLRNPRSQPLVQHTGPILSGPMPASGYQSVQRNNSDADRWDRGSNYNKGLMPSPHAPVPMMHKAERKYEVGKITDEEQAKQRKLKGILNKLTPQNFERLFEQVKEVNIDNVVTLTGVISQIFDKALTEPTFCEMYANFCHHLASELPDLSVENEKITFRRLLLNKCQEEFERGEREEQEANNVDGEGDTEQSEQVREEKRVKARRRMLGNIRLIGELYKKRMLTERIMHECIKKLLGQYQNPDEENIEALCKLMSTIGEMIDHSKAKEHMDAYFDIMRQLSNNMKLSSRVRFMLRDAIDLRKNKWQERRKVEGPKKIEEVHRDAAQERQGQVSRSNRGPSMNTSLRRGQPLEFGPRGSVLPPPMGQGMSFRGMPPQGRGYGGQDMRIDERNSFESRTFSVPLPQRLSSDEPLTLGPQGGLGKGLVSRAPSLVSSSPIFDNSLPFGDPRRMAGSMNGIGTVPERGGGYGTRDDHFKRNTTDRFGASVGYDRSSSQERNSNNTNREVRYPDLNVDRSRPTTPPAHRAEASAPQDTYSEEQLHSLSLAAIKEYYSAKDEKEVSLCIKDLNAPSFYPMVVSIWVSDSFERKNMERDLLAKLLVSLTKPQGGTFSPSQLYQGFESVLTNLEDTVNDAPKAPEFLGNILAKVVSENVLPLSDVGRLIQNGGEEPGRLLEVGLAAEVLGSLLEMIKSEKGETKLKEIRASCNLQLQDFRPPHPNRCQKLDMFM